MIFQILPHDIPPHNYANQEPRSVVPVYVSFKAPDWYPYGKEHKSLFCFASLLPSLKIVEVMACTVSLITCDINNCILPLLVNPEENKIQENLF